MQLLDIGLNIFKAIWLKLTEALIIKKNLLFFNIRNLEYL